MIAISNRTAVESHVDNTKMSKVQIEFELSQIEHFSIGLWMDIGV